MERNAVLVLGIAVALAGFAGMAAPHLLVPQGAAEETAKAVWLGALAFGVILMCVAPLLGPKKFYRAPKFRWSRFDTGARPTPPREFGRKGRTANVYREVPGSLHKAQTETPVLRLPPPK